MWSRLLSALPGLLAPHRCPRCGCRAEPPWCGTCDRDARRVPAFLACPRCGLPETDAGGSHPCWRADAPVSRSVHAYLYGGPVAEAIVAGKVAGAWAVWPALGDQLGEHAARASLEASVVVPVPTEPGRRRRRGVDHTAMLATAVGRRLGLPVRQLLTALPGQPDQGRRPVAERRQLPPEVFGCARVIPAVHALLVDDVLTTGGTATAAAARLRAAGASRVSLLTVARAGRHPLGGSGGCARR